MPRSVLRPILPSLGASGAVLACFAAAASFHPDNQVAFIFAPTASFPIIAGLQVHFTGFTVPDQGAFAALSQLQAVPTLLALRLNTASLRPTCSANSFCGILGQFCMTRMAQQPHICFYRMSEALLELLNHRPCRSLASNAHCYTLLVLSTLVGNIPNNHCLYKRMVQGVVAFDSVGILMRWQFMDHWAHIGGSGLGWLYATQGTQHIWENRQLRDWLLERRQEMRRIVAQL